MTFYRLLHGRLLKDIGSGCHFEGQEVEYHIQAVALQELNLELFSEENKQKFQSVERVLMDLSNFSMDSTFEAGEFIVKLASVVGSTGNPKPGDKFKFYDIFNTSGNDIFVSSDLLRIISNSERPSIAAFTHYTWEGSHFLVQIRSESSNEGSNLRVTLLSKHFAEIIYRDLISSSYPDNDWTFWLCDLSGHITATSQGQTDKGNILDVVPNAIYLIFDGLLFNGSLGNIVMSEKLNKIYENEWLNNSNFMNRAIFLLLRMKLLDDKVNHTLSITSEIYRKIERAAKGDASILLDAFNSVGSYLKPVTDELLKLQDGKRYGFKETDTFKVDLMERLKEIFGEITFTKSNAEVNEPEYSPTAYREDRKFMRLN